MIWYFLQLFVCGSMEAVNLWDFCCVVVSDRCSQVHPCSTAANGIIQQTDGRWLGIRWAFSWLWHRHNDCNTFWQTATVPSYKGASELKCNCVLSITDKRQYVMHCAFQAYTTCTSCMDHSATEGRPESQWSITGCDVTRRALSLLYITQIKTTSQCPHCHASCSFLGHHHQLQEQFLADTVNQWW